MMHVYMYPGDCEDMTPKPMTLRASRDRTPPSNDVSTWRFWGARSGLLPGALCTEPDTVNTAAENEPNSESSITVDNARAGLAEVSMRGRRASIDLIGSSPAAPAARANGSPSKCPRALGTKKVVPLMSQPHIHPAVRQTAHETPRPELQAHSQTSQTRARSPSAAKSVPGPPTPRKRPSLHGTVGMRSVALRRAPVALRPALCAYSFPSPSARADARRCRVQARAHTTAAWRPVSVLDEYVELYTW